MVSRGLRGVLSWPPWCRETSVFQSAVRLIVEVFSSLYESISLVARCSQWWYRYIPWPGPSSLTIAIPSAGPSHSSPVYSYTSQLSARYCYQLPLKFLLLKLKGCVCFLRRILFQTVIVLSYKGPFFSDCMCNCVCIVRKPRYFFNKGSLFFVILLSKTNITLKK